MNKLEVLGALFAHSCVDEGQNEALALMVAEAKDAISDEDSEAQFNLWRRLGQPSFKVVFSADRGE